MRRLPITLATIALATAILAPEARSQTWRGIWVAAPGDIWLVAAGSGTVVHGRAGSWAQATSPSGSLPDMNAVTGFGSNEVWMVGDEGTILHWNGASLSRPNSGTTANLVAIYGCAPNDIWAVGQSEDESQPPAILHYDGSSWSQQRITPTFRPSAIAGSCPGDLIITGISFFDPRPDQRRDVGVVARLRGGQWVASGWDGRRVTDDQLGGTAWTGAAAGGGSVLIWGRGKTLLSTRGGPWTPLNMPSAVAATMTADGSPIAIHAAGFSRFAGGQWRTVGQGALETAAGNAYTATAQSAAQSVNQNAGQRDTAAIRRITARMETISRAIPPGGMPNQQQMTEMMQLQQQLAAANGGSLMPGGMTMQQMQQMATQGQAASAEAQRNQAVAQRNQTLQFGENPVVVAGPGTDFYVAGTGGVMHVAGDASKVVFSAMCLYAGQVPASALGDCRADGGAGGPAPAMTVPPAPPVVTGPSIQAPTPGNPLPAIKKPSIRIPGRP